MGQQQSRSSISLAGMYQTPAVHIGSRMQERESYLAVIVGAAVPRLFVPNGFLRSQLLLYVPPTILLQEVLPDMVEFMANLRKEITIGVVGGSDLPKQKEQLGDSGALPCFLSCSGLLVDFL